MRLPVCWSPSLYRQLFERNLDKVDNTSWNWEKHLLNICSYIWSIHLALGENSSKGYQKHKHYHFWNACKDWKIIFLWILLAVPLVCSVFSCYVCLCNHSVNIIGFRCFIHSKETYLFFQITIWEYWVLYWICHEINT